MILDPDGAVRVVIVAGPARELRVPFVGPMALTPCGAPEFWERLAAAEVIPASWVGDPRRGFDVRASLGRVLRSMPPREGGSAGGDGFVVEMLQGFEVGAGFCTIVLRRGAVERRGDLNLRTFEEDDPDYSAESVLDGLGRRWPEPRNVADAVTLASCGGELLRAEALAGELVAALRALPCAFCSGAGGDGPNVCGACVGAGHHGPRRPLARIVWRVETWAEKVARVDAAVGRRWQSNDKPDGHAVYAFAYETWLDTRMFRVREPWPEACPDARERLAPAWPAMCALAATGFDLDAIEDDGTVTLTCPALEAGRP